jgi:hypothetical protein
MCERCYTIRAEDKLECLRQALESFIIAHETGNLEDSKQAYVRLLVEAGLQSYLPGERQ